MNIFIKELDEKDSLEKLSNLPKLVKKIVIKLNKILKGFIIVDIDENNKKVLISNIDKSNIFNKIMREIKKQKNITRKSMRIILSTSLKKYKSEFKNMQIIDSKNIIFENIEEIIKKIIQNIPLESIDLHILSNNYTTSNVGIIKKMAYKVKTVNVITKEIKKFSVLEEVLAENGVGICISNNKRKSLKNAKIIINLDYNIEDIKKFNVNRNACIINVNKDIIVGSFKGFEGIVINDVDIELEKEIQDFISINNLNSFKSTELYYCLNYLNRKAQKLNILEVYGCNGKISKKELINIEKILTN